MFMAMSLDTYRIKDGVGIVSLCDVKGGVALQEEDLVHTSNNCC